MAINPGKTEIACFDNENIYLLDYSSLKLVRKWKHTVYIPEYYNIQSLHELSLFYFNPTKPNQLIARFRYETALYSYPYESPSDSTFAWDIDNGTVVAKFAGNCYFSLTRTHYLIAINQYSPLSFQGVITYPTHGGSLRTMPGNININYKNALRKIAVNPSGSLAAINFYDGYQNDTARFSLEIRTPDSLKVLKRYENLKSLLSLLAYSKTGKYLAFCTHQNETKTDAVVLLDSTGCGTAKIFNGSDQENSIAASINTFDFSENDSLLLVQFRQGINIYQISTGNLLYQISSNLSSGWLINGARFLNDTLLIVCGLKDSDKSTGFAERIDVRKLRIFTTPSRDTTFRVYSPEDTRIQMNDFIKGPTDLHWSGDGKTFSFVKENVLEIWDATRRKKKFIHSFEEEIRAFPDASGRFILAFEGDVVSIDKIHILNINTGVLTSRSYHQKDFSFGYPIQCVPDIKNDSTWYFSDGDRRSLWKYDCQNSTFTKWMEFQPDSLVGFQPMPDGGKWVIELKKEKKYTLELFDMSRKIITDSLYAGNRVIPFDISSANDLLFADQNNNLIQYDYGIKETTRLLAFPGDLEITSLGCSPDNKNALVGFMVHRRDQHFDSCAWIDIRQKKDIETFKKDYGTYRPVGNGELALFGMDGISSFRPGGHFRTEWTIKNHQAFAGQNQGIDDSGRYFLSYDDLIDLSTGQSVNTFKNCRHESKALIPGSKPLSVAHVYSDLYSDTSKFYGIRIINAFNNQVLASTRKPINSNKAIDGWSAIYSSPKGIWFFCPTDDFTSTPTTLWHYPDMKEITFTKREEYPHSFIFSPREDILYVNMGKLFHTDGEEYSNRISLPEGKIDGKFSFKIDAAGDEPDEVFSISLYNIQLLKINKTGTKVEQTYCSRTVLSSMYYDQENQRIFGGAMNGRIFCWNKNRPVTPEFVLEGGSSEVIQVLLRNERLFAFFRNGDVQIWDLDSRKQVVQIRVLDIKDNLHYFYHTPEGYYMGEKNILTYLHFIRSNTPFPFFQFDLQYNRPDIVLERMGQASPELIESYRKAYTKRLKKLNFDESMFSPEFHTPEIQILNIDSIKPAADSRLQTIRIKATDNKFYLDRINVWVNDVPVYGMNGIALRGQKKNSVVMKIPVDLSQGENNVQVSCLNEKGVESLKESFKIKYEPANPEKSNVYFIGIGVSDYKDSRLNLTYAAKDIRDLAALFRKKNPDLITDTLLNDHVTRQNVLELKKSLFNTKIDDEVILAISGHGFLSDSLDFYYGTSDIDYKHPEVKGLSYDDIEWLLDSIPARKKLVFMDACHSGEVDKDVKGSKGGVQLAKNVKVSSRKGIEAVVDSASIGLQNSYELMQELFANLSKGNGAVVISAAGGLEYAYEGPDWKNGVFTYSVRKGLSDSEADLDRDGTITVNELKNYLYKQVETLTNGRQKPTSRQESLESDWRVW